MKRIAMLLSTAALAAGLVVAAGGTAQAAPGGCTTWTSGNKGRYGNGKCTSGSGEYRLHGRCNIPSTCRLCRHPTRPCPGRARLRPGRAHRLEHQACKCPPPLVREYLRPATFRKTAVTLQ